MIKSLLIALWADEAGFILSAELVLIGTVLVMGLTVGLVSLRNSLGAEMTDLSHAFRQLDQSYGLAGIRGCRTLAGWTSWTAGSKFLDETLREPESEQDIIVEDHIVGSNDTFHIASNNLPDRYVEPAGPLPGGSSWEHPITRDGLPGGMTPPPLMAPEFAEFGAARVPALPAPSSALPAPCPTCSPSGLPRDQSSPVWQNYGTVRPTPSSDIPPRSRWMGFDGGIPDVPPIPKMPAGPLQVW